MQKNKIALLMDIGGTNIRMGLSELTDKLQMPTQIQTMSVRDFANLTPAIESYLSDKPSIQVNQLSISIASPVFDNTIKLTNHNWIIDVKELAENFKLKRVKVINDFTALALSIPFLSSSDLRKVGDGEAQIDASIALIGPGTGLGVSGLHKICGDWSPIEGEGGHITVGARDSRELLLFDVIRSKYGHVSGERLLSGSGIEDVYQTLCLLDGKTPESDLKAPDISGYWKTQSCEISIETMELFCSWLGVVAGNLALTLGAQGGVYIGGGIVPKLGEDFINSSFRESFDNHGRFSKYLSSIPVYIIQAENPALLGVAVALDKKYDSLGVNYQP